MMTTTMLTTTTRHADEHHHHGVVVVNIFIADGVVVVMLVGVVSKLDMGITRRHGKTWEYMGHGRVFPRRTCNPP